MPGAIIDPAEPSVTVGPGAGGLERAVLAHPEGGRVEVYLHGAHVTSWTDPSGDERLYLSPRTRFEAGAAIRGGIPVVFPQFADLGPLPKHGFARTAPWTLAGFGASPREGARVVLRLTDTPVTRAVWDHAFRADLTVTLTEVLHVSLVVTNTGAGPFEFTCALHTYFRVGDVRRAAVLGLKDVPYRDKVKGEDGVEKGDALYLRGETDRVYLGAPYVLRIRDGAEGRMTLLRKNGFSDAVVWNPWEEKAAAMDDLGADEFPHMLCVEAAQVGTPVRLDPGARWEGVQVLSR